MFVEDHHDTYGLDKATNLSIVWGNMKFLGCSYPRETEALVAHYPLPPLDELRRRRREHAGEEASPPSRKQRRKPNDTEISTGINDLITSVRREHDIKSTSQMPAVVQTIASKLCLCEQCTGKLGESSNAADRLNKVLQRYTSRCAEAFVFEYLYEEREQDQTNICRLLINDEVVMERSGAKKRDAKCAVAADVLAMIEEQQRVNGKPECPRLAAKEGIAPQLLCFSRR